MLTIRPLICLFGLSAIVAVLFGCQSGGNAAVPSAAPATTTATQAASPAPAATATPTDEPPPSAGEVARLIRGLGREEIAPGEAAGGMQFFAGEFDRYRCPAADELARLDSRTAGPALKRVLNDADPVMRRNAAITLARLGDAAGADSLYDLLDDPKQAPIISAVIINSLATLTRSGGPPLRWARLEPAFQRWQAGGQRSCHGQVAILSTAYAADDETAARRLMVANFHSRDAALRHAALQGAVAATWPDGLPAAVLAALDDGHPRIVLAAIAVLNAHGEAASAAVEHRLAEMIRHGDSRVRQSAIAAVVKLRPNNARRMLLDRLDDHDLQVQRDAVRAMAEMEDIEGLRAALGTRRFRIRLTAAEALGNLGAAAIPLLKIAAQDDSFNVRRTVAESVLEIGDPRGAAIVVDLLNDRAVTVRIAARQAYEILTGERLINYQPQNSVEQNAPAVEQARAFIAANSREWAAAAATDGGHSSAATPQAEAVDLLLRGLALPPGYERTISAETLVSLGPDTLSLIEQRLADQPVEVVNILLAEVLPEMDEVYAMLRALRQVEVDATVRRRNALRLNELTRVRQLPAPAVAQLVDVLQAERDPIVRRLLGERLLGWRPPNLGQAAATGLRMADAQSRQLAAVTVGIVRYAPAYGDLLALLSDDAQQVRQAAAEALGRFGDRRAIPVLREKLIAARAVTDRLAYGAALARLGDVAGRDELIRLLAETDESVRYRVMEAMGEAGDRAFIAPLIDRLALSDIPQTGAAIDALEQITGLSMGDPRTALATRRETIARWRRWFDENAKITIP